MRSVAVFALLASVCGEQHSVLVEQLVARGSNISSRVDINADAVLGRYAVATDDIASGTVIFTTPYTNCLIGRDHTTTHTTEQSLAATLLEAKHSATPDMWTTYVSQLPTQYITGVAFTEADIQCLSRSAEAQRAHLFGEYEAFKKSVARGFEEADLEWAFASVLTRAIRVPNGAGQHEGKAALVPFLDFLNHNSSSNIGLTADAFGFALFATRDIQAEEPLTLNYGAHLTPSKLLVHYGFADSSFEKLNSYLSFPDTPETAPLKLAGCLPSGTENPFEDIYVSKDGTLSPKLIECVTVSVLPTAIRKEYHNLLADAKLEVLAEHRSVALQVYSSHIEKVLTLYPTLNDERCGGEADVKKTPSAAKETILRHNAQSRAVYLLAKENIIAEIAEIKGAKKVVVEKDQQERRRRRRERRRAREAEEEEEEEGEEEGKEL